jgi:beta-galactosidase GanA
MVLTENIHASQVAVMHRQIFTVTFAVLAASLTTQLTAQDANTPHLEQRGAATQLIVDGKPFVMLAGELTNSSSSSLEYMKPIWPKLAAASLNTVVTPLSWELIEPSEGKFDFTLVDGLIARAREQHLHLVFLWLASWKNGMSSYPPVWVKQDTKRFPRVVEKSVEYGILSPQGMATRDADARAFTALMKHIKAVDGKLHTVLAMQVENEVGVLGDSRDRSAEADAAFAAAVPDALPRYLKAHQAALDPELRALWEQLGAKTSGTWAQMFGDGPRADEIFMAWQYARFVHAVAAAGKAAYDIPMYVNCWLPGEKDGPGNYPSGGPQPRVVDIWKAAAPASGPGTSEPSIDIYAPDLYAADFEGWSKRYHRDGNPLFMPETNAGAAGAANVFYAVGEHQAICFSPFAIERALDRPPVPDTTPRQPGQPPRPSPPELSASYRVLAEIWPLLSEAQVKGETHGFLLDQTHPSFDFPINGYIAHVSLDGIFGHQAEKGFGLIFATGPGEFYGAGAGFRVAFTLPDGSKTPAGIGAVEEGHFEDGKWAPGRRLNGDENDQGNYWRFDQFQVKIERATVFKYE